MRRVFLWAARNRWLKERLPRLRVHAPGRPPVHARRDARGRAGAAAAVQAAGIGDDVHAARREPREPGRGRRGRRALHRASSTRSRRAGIDGEISVKPTQLGLDHDADVCLAHLERLAEHAAADRLVPLDRHGRQRVHRRDDRALRAPPRGPAERPGICLQAYLRRTAADIERLLPLDPGDPPGQGRLRRAGVDRLPDKPARSTRTTSPSRSASCSTGAGRPIRLGLGTHDVALIEQIAASVAPAGVGRDGVRGPDALRHPDRRAVPAGEGRLSGPGPHRVRRGVVSVVHAPPRGAAGQRLVRPPPDAALGRGRRGHAMTEPTDRRPDEHDRDRDARSRSPPGPAPSRRRAATSSTSRSASPTSTRRRTSARPRSGRSTRARPTTRRSPASPQLREAIADGRRPPARASR